MSKPYQRVGALLLAILFLGSSIAVSALVFMQVNEDEKNSNQITQQTSEQACEIGSESGETKAVPETFKPEGDVTALQTADLKVGNGAEAKAGDCLLVKYHGTLATTGEKFDGNFDEPSVLKFPLGQGSVITGWDQGVTGMKEGGVRRLVIPSELAYGDQSPSETIPPNSDMVFVVELIKIQK